MTAITQLENQPDINDPINFNAESQVFWLTTIPTMIDEMNAAITAFNLNAVQATSTTSIAIGVGSKVITVQTNKSFLPGMMVLMAVTASGGTNFQFGRVDSYVIGTGVLTFTVGTGQFGGSGTFAAWSVMQIPEGGVTTSILNQTIQQQSTTAVTTTGAATAYVATLAVPITANVNNHKFDVTFHVAAGLNPTIAYSGQTALNLKYQDSSGALQAINAKVCPIGWRSEVVTVGTDAILQKIAPAISSGSFSRVMSAASGNVAITGVGFKPRRVRFYMASSLSATHAQFSIGEDNGVFAMCVYDTNAALAGTNSVDLTASIRAQGVTGVQQGKILTMDADGFTIAWTLTSTGSGITGTIGYIAEA